MDAVGGGNETEGTSKVPRGIPSLTYLRVVPTSTNNNSNLNQQQLQAVDDITVDGNAVVIKDPSSNIAPMKYEVAEVFGKHFNDEEVCEHVIGSRAGDGIGAALNPVTAFVNDAATAVIFTIGSRQAKKWRFLKVPRYI